LLYRFNTRFVIPNLIGNDDYSLRFVNPELVEELAKMYGKAFRQALRRSPLDNVTRIILKIKRMHPYIEILFSLFLATSGMLMIRKLSSLKRRRTSNVKNSYATEKQIKLISKKISLKFTMVLFALIMIVAITILIEKGIMTVTW